MIIEKIETKRNKTTVYSDTTEYEFAPEIIAKYDIKEGETNGKTFFDAKKESDKLLCKRRLYSLVDRSEKSKQGYLDALTQRGYPYPIAKEAVEEAEKKGLIDDRRFAECYLHTHEKSKGWFRLSAELRSKGVSEEIVESFREDYSDHAAECKKLAEKYMRSVENTYENRQKVFLKLMRKGYSVDEIGSSMRAFGDYDGSDS